jgi:hypothetical protein
VDPREQNPRAKRVRCPRSVVETILQTLDMENTLKKITKDESGGFDYAKYCVS